MRVQFRSVKKLVDDLCFYYSAECSGRLFFLLRCLKRSYEVTDILRMNKKKQHYFWSFVAFGRNFDLHA